MNKTMCNTFNGTLGRFGCIFLGADMLDRNEIVLSKDETMIRLQVEIEALSELKNKIDKTFKQQAIDIREKARVRIKQITEEKYV